MSLSSTTGPLIALAKADQLELLKTMFKEVQIPPAVHRELLVTEGPEAQRLDDALQDFVWLNPLPWVSPNQDRATLGMSAAEKQAVALADILNATLLSDDRVGRAAARALGIKVTGTAGVLIRAKQQGLIPLVRPVLDEIRRNGYWLSDAVVEAAARLAGE